MPDDGTNGWPRLRVADWADTRDTLHMWTQIVGKVRMTGFLDAAYEAAAELAGWDRVALERRADRPPTP